MKKIADMPIFKDVFEDVTFNYIASHSKHVDELAIVLKGHLFIEYMLDILIKKKIPKTTIILKYNFSKKLDILYSLDLIPIYLYKNISYFNKIRNRFAHNIKYDLSKEKLLFYKEDETYVELMVKKYSSRQRIRLFCLGILNQINYHFISNLKIAPIFK